MGKEQKLMIIVNHTNQTKISAPPLYHNHHLEFIKSNVIMAKWLPENFQNFIICSPKKAEGSRSANQSHIIHGANNSQY